MKSNNFQKLDPEFMILGEMRKFLLIDLFMRQKKQ